MKLKTIIVDDEPLAREGIKLRLLNDNDIEIIGEYGNGRDAVNAISIQLPDLVFLDIQMPEINGFELISKISSDNFPFIIFVTAYDKYALKAFEVHALDYLLKPINDDRFNQALQRVKGEYQKESFSFFENRIKSLIKDYSAKQINAMNLNADTDKKIKRIALKSKTGFSLLDVEEIEWIEAAGDYVYLHCDNKKHLHRETMASFECNLNPEIFQRIHRSVIVNINKVKEIQSADHGDYSVHLSSGTKVKLSRNYKDKFLSVLKINSQ
jgi:two-component system LytT family response regulator